MAVVETRQSCSRGMQSSELTSRSSVVVYFVYVHYVVIVCSRRGCYDSQFWCVFGWFFLVGFSVVLVGFCWLLFFSCFILLFSFYTLCIAIIVVIIIIVSFAGIFRL